MSNNPHRKSAMPLLEKLAWVAAFLLVFAYLLKATWSLVNNFFVFDDLSVLCLGPQLRQNPLAFISFTYYDWWRPLGFGLPGLVYLIFGLNTALYHYFGLLIHLLAALALTHLGRKLFNSRVGMAAALLYLISPIFVSAFTFIAIVCEDALYTIFLVMCIACAIRGTQDTKNESHPYIASAVFLLLASLCKDSWFGLFPALLWADWRNYPKQRITRRFLRLLPALAVVLIIPLRFFFVSLVASSVSMQNYFSINFNPQNFLWGITLPFLPLQFGAADAPWQWLRLLLPILVIAFLLLLGNKEDRSKTILLLLAFGGMVLALASTMLINTYWGWMHLPPLIALSALLLLQLASKVATKWSWQGAFISLSLGLTGLYLLLSHPTVTLLRNYAHEDSQGKSEACRSLAVIAQTLPQNSHLFAFAGVSYEFARDNYLRDDLEYTLVFARKNPQKGYSPPHTIYGEFAEVISQLQEEALKPGFVFIIQNEKSTFIDRTALLQKLMREHPNDQREFQDLLKGTMWASVD